MATDHSIHLMALSLTLNVTFNHGDGLRSTLGCLSFSSFSFSHSLVPFPHLIQPFVSLISFPLFLLLHLPLFLLRHYRIRESTSQASSTASSYLSEFLSKPKLWVSSLGLVNSILLGGLGFFAYTRRDQIRNADRRLLTAGVVGVLALLGGQG